jgi:glycine/D-amino acid oxidase-like deaminating enzyme
MFPGETEIVVIGGGVVGSSTAYFLSKAGKEVVLLEKGYKAGEASAANSAFVWTITRKPGIDVRLAMHSFDIIQRLQEELDIDFEFRRPGGLLVINDEEQIPYMERHLKERADDGFPLERMDARQALESEPLLSKEKTLGAVFSPAAGTVNPINLIISLNNQARKLGAQVFHHTAVRGIGIADGKVRHVMTDKGMIKAETVVNAAGSWSADIAAMAGITVPVSPFQMAVLVTEQLPPCVFHPIMGASYMIEEDAGKKGGLGCGLIASQQVSGNLLLGNTWRNAGFDKSTGQREIELMAGVDISAMPSLRHVRVIRSFANFFPHTDDDLPILGVVEGMEGFITACGHNGHGICMGPGSGKLIQELICEGETAVPVDGLNLSRFCAKKV